MLNPEHFIPLGEWKLYGEGSQPEREAKKLAGRLLVFYKGTAVVKHQDKFRVKVWGEPQKDVAAV